nr:hypothetical protein [Tanacetum cinerariifolium]
MLVEYEHVAMNLTRLGLAAATIENTCSTIVAVCHHHQSWTTSCRWSAEGLLQLQKGMQVVIHPTIGGPGFYPTNAKAEMKAIHHAITVGTIPPKTDREILAEITQSINHAHLACVGMNLAVFPDFISTPGGPSSASPTASSTPLGLGNCYTPIFDPKTSQSGEQDDNGSDDANHDDLDAEYALSRLLRRGSVTEYYNEFEILISQVTRKFDSLLASIYIFGLKPTPQRALLSNPTTLGEAFSLARIAKARLAEDVGQKHIHDFDETAMLLITDKDDDPGEAAMDEGGEFNDRLDEITLDLSQEFVIGVLKSRDVFGGSLVGFLKWVYREKNCEVFSVRSR